MKIMRVIIAILLVYIFPLSAMTLKEKFSHAHPGEYIVTEQSKNYSILFIRAITPNSIILEEITAPESSLDPAKQTWSAWIQERAPGHTSWISYEIDLESDRLMESYSYTENRWLYLQDSDYLMAKLLTLQLTPVKESNRRKIGPPPASGEHDTRSIWNPALVIDGKKVTKPKSEVFHGVWPEDNTLVAGCGIEFYFDAGRPQFPFPFWIEIQSRHYALKIRTIDTGTGLTSPMPLLPHKTPAFLGVPQKNGENLQLILSSPYYYKKFHLFAIDLSASDKAPIPITASIIRGQEGEILLQVQQKDLQEILIQGHSYRWVVTVEENKDAYTEMYQPFLWNP
jgi:hypothetical protein